MEIRHLRAFVAVIEHGSVTRAARALGLTQPSVSMTLGELRQELGGAPLFQRVGRGLDLAPAGRLLRELALPVLEGWRALPARIQEGLGEAPHGPVRVGAGEGAVLYPLPEPLRRFRRRFPHVEVILRNQPSDESVAMLRSGELDFALRGWARAPRGIAYQPTLRFPRMLIAPVGHPLLGARPLTLAGLAAHAFVMPWPQSALRQAIERALDAAGLACRIGLEAGGWEIIKRYVGLGFGIGIVPAFVLGAEDRRRLGARPVTKLFGEDVYGIATRSQPHLSRPAMELARLIAPTAGPGAPEPE
jgi:DNA-binding transcriptional LysR family regulator